MFPSFCGHLICGIIDITKQGNKRIEKTLMAGVIEMARIPIRVIMQKGETTWKIIRFV